MLMAGAIYAGQVDVRGLKQETVKAQKPVQIGDIRVTPYAVDHSAFDSMAFLLEADGRRLLYSGDLRLHGREQGMAKVMVEAATKLFEQRGMRRIDIHADAFYTAAEMASVGKKTGAEL